MKRPLLALLPLTIFLTACAQPTLEPTHTIPPTLTKLPSITPTNPFSITWTPFPDLSPLEKEEKIIDLLSDNGDCMLPCIWGFTPGVTSLDSMKQFLGSFGYGYTSINLHIYTNDWGLGYLSIEKNLETRIEFRFSLEKDSINYLSLGGYTIIIEEEYNDEIFGDKKFNQLMEYYSISQILYKYGPPSLAYLYKFDEPARSYSDYIWYPMYLVLFYKEQHFSIQYFISAYIEENLFNICPHKSHIEIVSWDPEISPLPMTVLSKTGSGHFIEGYNYKNMKQIDEATTYTMESFYSTFSDTSSTPCITSPVEIWESE